MVYDRELADRIRRLLPTATEKQMFGGMGLMERGNLVAGVSGDDLIVRVPPEETPTWLDKPGAHGMFPGKAMKGWVRVSSGALQDDAVLARWVSLSRATVKRLPAK